jgi:nucleotide-binding universal stress UspA family protein
MAEVHSWGLVAGKLPAIVVGFDGSRTSMRASAYAVGLARRQRARLVAVYVGSVAPRCITEPSVGPFIVAEHRAAFERTVASLRKEAEELAYEQDIAVTFVATHGDSFTEIHRIAEEVSADAIVVGASTKAVHRLAGSLAVRLVRSGKWPVTVIP